MAETENAKSLKLFVAGQYSSDPDDWVEDSRTKLVLAFDEKQAREMCDDVPGDVMEVAFTRPTVVIEQIPPHYWR